MAGKVVGCLDVEVLEFCGIAPANAPDFGDGIEFECLVAFWGCVDNAAVVVALVLFCEVAGHFCKCLVWCDSDADGYADGAFDFGVELFAPVLQVGLLNIAEIGETFINAVAEICWCLLAYDCDYSAG